jgi:hypothetical protein
MAMQRLVGNQAVTMGVVAPHVQRACCAACARGEQCESTVQRTEDELDGDADEREEPVVPASPDVDTSELDGIAEDEVEAGPPVQRQEVAAPAQAGGDVACDVFADLTGFPRRNRGARAFAALTAFRFTRRRNRFTASFNRGGSWVNTFQVPIGGRRTPQVAGQVGRCQRAFRRRIAHFEVQPAGDCPAVAAVAHRATTRAECDTVIGAGLDAEARADLPRLTRHEQYHLRLACALADLANAALAGGAPIGRVARQLSRASRRETAAYDRDSGHGCDAAEQARWETEIDAGTVTFP